MTPRIIAMIVGAALIVAALIFGPAACNRYLTEKKSGQISRGQGQATLNSMDEANNTMILIDETERATDDAVTNAQGEVRAAAEGQKGVTGASAACRFKANRNKPQCQPKGPTQ